MPSKYLAATAVSIRSITRIKSARWKFGRTIRRWSKYFGGRYPEQVFGSWIPIPPFARPRKNTVLSWSIIHPRASGPMISTANISNCSLISSTPRPATASWYFASYHRRATGCADGIRTCLRTSTLSAVPASIILRRQNGLQLQTWCQFTSDGRPGAGSGFGGGFGSMRATFSVT